MLSLTRKRDEEIVMWVEGSAEPVVIRLVMGESRSSGTLLHFDAPKQVRIMRKEIMKNYPGGDR